MIVFGGMGLIFDDYYFFRKAFEEAGMFARTVMFVNQASDPVVERLLIPDLALFARRVAWVRASSIRSTTVSIFRVFRSRPEISLLSDWFATRQRFKIIARGL